MTNQQIVEEFERSWVFTRKLTLDFAEGIPEEHWNYSFSEKYSPLCKQLRHMIWVTGLYTEAFKNRVLDFKNKKTNYGGGLSRGEILAALKVSDRELLSWLMEAKRTDLESYRVQAFGVEMGFSEFSHLLIEHEGNHHGLWSTYASLAGFKTPSSWKETWGL